MDAEKPEPGPRRETPKQRRRKLHKRGGKGVHRQRQRAARKTRIALMLERLGYSLPQQAEGVDNDTSNQEG
jgi:hypothetical protein